MPSDIVIPRTSFRLKVLEGTQMYLRGVEGFIGTKHTYLHNCERRYQPLYIGGPTQEMDQVNDLRILDVGQTLDRWRIDAGELHEEIVQYRLHLSPEIQGFHTTFEIHVNLMREDPVPRIVIPDQTGPKIKLEEILKLERIV